MSFHFKHNERLADGARRIIGKQIDTALQLLGNEALDRKEVVHETRKVLKRIRATLHLVDFDRPETFEKENRRYRNIGRLLTRQRDADILPDTFDKLIRDYTKHLEGLTLNNERAFTATHARDLLARDDFSRLKSRIVRELEDAREAVPHWGFKKADLAAVTTIVPSLVETSYSRAKDNFLTVCQNPTQDKMHNWRKRVKDLLYQSELLSKTDLKFSPAYREALDKLAERLGAHHDLTVLYDVVSEHGVRAGENLAVEGLVELIVMEQSRLETKAIKIGSEVFHDNPPDFIKHLGWN